MLFLFLKIGINFCYKFYFIFVILSNNKIGQTDYTSGVWFGLRDQVNKTVGKLYFTYENNEEILRSDWSVNQPQHARISDGTVTGKFFLIFFPIEKIISPNWLLSPN